MAGPMKGCLKNTAIGCGALILLGIGAFGVLIFVSVNPFGDAIAAREQLDDRFGDQAAYRPPADGEIAPDRLDAFLSVRQAVYALCDGFQETEQQFQSMERFDDAEEVKGTEVLGEALKTTRMAFGLAPRIGELFEVRNQALLDAEMGLGEYSYIYVVAYHDRLVGPRTERLLFDDPDTNRRVRLALRSMLERQLEELRSADMPPESTTALEAEIAAMEEDPDRLPWQDGLPAEIAASVAPQRERLDALYCQSTASLDLLRNTRHGLSIESE